MKERGEKERKRYHEEKRNDTQAIFFPLLGFLGENLEKVLSLPSLLLHPLQCLSRRYSKLVEKKFEDWGNKEERKRIFFQEITFWVLTSRVSVCRVCKMRDTRK